MMNFEECLREGHLKRINPDVNAAEKELASAGQDLVRAGDTIQTDAKWSIIQSYYSMFHAAKALLFSAGLKEKGHFAVQIALEELAKEGDIELIYTVNFAAAREARENSNYRHIYSQATAETILEYAQSFLETMKQKVNELKSNKKKKAGVKT